MTDAPKVVLIDERSDRRRIMREILLASGAAPTDIAEADDFAAASEIVAAEGAGAVVIERQFPIEQCLSAIAGLRDRFPLLSISISSFGGDDEATQLELAAGANHHLIKPLRSADMRDIVALLKPADPESGSPLVSATAQP